MCKECDKVFCSLFSNSRLSECLDANKKLVKAFLKIWKSHSAIEVFPMDPYNGLKRFPKCLLNLHTKRQTFKNEIIQVARNVIQKLFWICFIWSNRAKARAYITIWNGSCYRYFDRICNRLWNTARICRRKERYWRRYCAI